MTEDLQQTRLDTCDGRLLRMTQDWRLLTKIKTGCSSHSCNSSYLCQFSLCIRLNDWIKSQLRHQRLRMKRTSKNVLEVQYRTQSKDWKCQLMRPIPRRIGNLWNRWTCCIFPPVCSALQAVWACNPSLYILLKYSVLAYLQTE